jgi:hypothetical protein
VSPKRSSIRVFQKSKDSSRRRSQFSRKRVSHLDDIIDLEREDFLRLAGIAPEEADR